jgi:sugar O-acyltransferase (sialic acid O-acetyltransferase NeuD family)
MIVIIGLDLDLVGLIESESPIKEIGYIDLEDKRIESLNYLGSDDKLIALLEDSNNEFFFGIDDSVKKQFLIKEYKLNTSKIISSKARVFHTTSIGQGTIVQDFVYLSKSTEIGQFCKINVGAQIHHEVVISDLVTVAPRACILGNAKVGMGSFIGAGSIILPRLKIGENCIIGAGSVVTSDVKDNTKVKGNPARTF